MSQNLFECFLAECSKHIGWSAMSIECVTHIVHLHAACPHGHVLNHAISEYMLYQIEEYDQLIHVVVGEMMATCKFHHDTGPYSTYTENIELITHESLSKNLDLMANMKLSPEITVQSLSELQKLVVNLPSYKSSIPYYPPHPQPPSFYPIASTPSLELAKLFPGMKNSSVECPECASPSSIAGTIMHLNDSHGKSREFIADWLDSLDIDLSMKGT